MKRLCEGEDDGARYAVWELGEGEYAEVTFFAWSGSVVLYLGTEVGEWVDARGGRQVGVVSFEAVPLGKGEECFRMHADNPLLHATLGVL